MPYVDVVIPSDKQWLVADRYQLTNLIGRGGMGAVWRATDHLLQRTVAVKELPPGGDGDGSWRALREARAIARVSHPSVIDIYDLVEFEDRLWIVMELVDGPSLSHHLDSVGPLPPSRVAEIGLQLLDALEAVHAVGALHRDVKPANVLLRGNGGVVLTDFGIAALTDGDSMTHTGEVMGSLDFIAPERLHGKPAGPPSDLFSLGVTLCVLVSGRSPFAQPAPAAVLHAVAYEEPDIPDWAGPLGMLIEGMLHKDPARRLSAADTADALRSMGTSEPGTLKHTRRAPTLPPPPRHRGLRWAAISLAALLVAGGAVTAFMMSRPPVQHADDAAATQSAHPAQPDAVLQAPRDRNRYWVFSGSRYVVIEVADDGRTGKPVADPRPLSNWPSLSGFRRVDAVMQTPDDPNRYWVFSGNQYVRIEVADDTHADKRVADPRPLSNWPSLKGFARIDAVMQAPDDPSRYWVFSGNQYVKIEIADDTHADQRILGPRPLGDWKDSFPRA
ncbi:protein kinase [Streptomyces sp. NPDC006678]|uniref:protein kinase domain-containing protein n=1 Tax=Streptomyces sp. NPDC006678 TaxID=3157185 RepID=UPI0033C27F27